MNMRCKNGDLAIVIRDNEGCEANVGRLVEVRGPVVSSMYGEEVTWQIAQVEQNTPWLIEENDGTITAEIATWDSRVLHPDSWLKPIRPEAEDPLCQTTCRSLKLWLIHKGASLHVKKSIHPSIQNPSLAQGA